MNAYLDLETIKSATEQVCIDILSKTEREKLLLEKNMAL